MTFKAPPRLDHLAEALIDKEGPTNSSGYIAGKQRLEQAIARLVPNADRAANWLKRLEDAGYVRFINRVGFDEGASFWRITARPL
ncbi:MAG: hypothetical protein RMA76_00955 [Deltaproteobacteria bacterium]|jgi:hypothetical protein